MFATRIPPDEGPSMTAQDPIALELFKNALFSIADEMAVTVVRTTYSSVLKNNMDFSTAVGSADGRLVAQGLTLPLHLGSMPDAFAAVLRRFEGDIHPGDAFILNDPFDGGTHLPDIFLLKPVFFEGRRVAFAAACCHHTDVGGRVAGSNASDSTEIYQEGLRIPPLKLHDHGRPNETFLALLERNVRVPAMVLGDLRAQLAACSLAERQLVELYERYGSAPSAHYVEAVLDQAEELTRAALRDLPDGVFSFEDWIDDDGIDVGKPIRLFVTLTKQGDSLKADWTGTDPQVKGAINNTLSFTKAATYCAIRSVLPPGIPNNDGVFRAIEVKAPPGTIANMVLPGACAARGLTGFRMVDCCFGALAQMVPDKVFAASDGGNTGVSIGGYHADRSPFIYVDFACGTWGGRPHADGLSGVSNVAANMASISVEVTEAEHPVEILAYELVPDRAGPGQFRGGAPYCREYRLLADEAVLQVRSDRRAFRPYGLQGGAPGAPSANVLNPGPGALTLPSKVTATMNRGDVLRLELAGPGGWGDPLERDPAAVLADVRDELIGEAAARDVYGVVIDRARWAVCADETAALRRRLRAARGWREVPAVTRGRSA
jgi:N-methylhydantoinase B